MPVRCDVRKKKSHNTVKSFDNMPKNKRFSADDAPIGVCKPPP